MTFMRAFYLEHEEAERARERSVDHGERVDAFREAAEAAYRLAEKSHYDIAISKEESGTGTIQLRSGLFNSIKGKTDTGAFARLADAADEITVEAVDDFVVMTLLFDESE